MAMNGNHNLNGNSHDREEGIEEKAAHLHRSIFRALVEDFDPIWCASAVPNLGQITSNTTAGSRYR